MLIGLPQPWTPVDFINNIRLTFHDQQEIKIHYVAINEPKCASAGPLNEVIDTVVEMSHELI